jgi:phosphorylase kinase alpha/beta subunit
MAHLHAADGKYEQTFYAMFDIFQKHRWKIQHHMKHKPREAYEYIHPRYNAKTFEELRDPWGNAQNDAIGLFLFGVGQGLQCGKNMFRDTTDMEITKELAEYLITLEFWHDADNGMWEENREVHSSSVGACLAGLKAIQSYLPIQDTYSVQGEEALLSMLPRESESKACDLAQLSLVYPYQLLSKDLATTIVRQVEEQLMRARGVIRYLGDRYHQEEGQEAEWCFGFPWLGLCWAVLGDHERAMQYLKYTEEIMFAPGVIPELYYGGTTRPNANTPLAWANAMYLQLYDTVHNA